MEYRKSRLVHIFIIKNIEKVAKAQIANKNSLEDKIKWDKEVARTNNPLDFYETHYAGLDRGQLRQKDYSL